MGEIIASIRHGFGGVLRFSGRERRGLFWPYAIFIFLAASLISYAAMIPELMRSMRGAFELVDAQRNAPGPALSPEQIDAMAMQLMPNFEGMMLATLIVDIVAVALLAAAVARRLHDRDRAGWWGLLPLPGFAIGFALAPAMLEGFRRPMAPPDPNLISILMLTNLASWALLVFLIVLLAQEGSAGPNRFGPEPADS